MADNWQPGDLALCVKATAWRYPELPAPTSGQVCTVRRVGLDRAGEVGLWLEGFPGETPRHGFRALRFRKIHPLNEAEHAAAMRELNAPVREPVS